ncbi:DUF4153 domain-containing protein [Hymenobacter cavernae]|uniref:DUF4173 domain-containing protein n=1 Tax=Hymenobacter cavernae TaxID=2044852 RepID=A0ABQ1TL29_9BACT|nr:DUF4173 domain-containing protein [Hymenobacter cavernae]GGE95572.1 hypothetical protein GCM10011383_02890 [Hymenobacter cavernae]
MRFPLTSLQKLLLPLGAVLFDFLFWQQQAGLNLLLYTMFVVGAVLAGLPRHAPVWRSGYFKAALSGTLLSGALVALYGSFVAKLACVVSLAMVLGYVNQPDLKLVAYALLTALGNLGRAVPALLKQWEPPQHTSVRLKRVWFYSRLLLVPVGLLVLFHVLFSVANPRYDALAARFFTVLGEWLAQVFEQISVPHLLFFLLGLALTASALIIVPIHFFADHESRFGEFVRRQRDRVASFAVRRPDFSAKPFHLLDLRKEYLAALAVFGLVNVLLLVENLVDITWIWFGFVPEKGFNLTQFVHEGTYVLILSILVAMGIVLWFFRRNLNFYAPGLRWLRLGATVWVVQNAVLAVSVGLRNYYYILHMGLAYKRIGVYGFLLLTLFGLGTILLKIWQRRSAYSLVRLNALAAYGVLLLLAGGNWENWITRYNLQSRFDTLDLGFLLNMPGRMLPELMEKQAVLTQIPHLLQDTPSGTVDFISAQNAQRLLDQRVATWLHEYETERSWKSWTYADAQAYETLHRRDLTSKSRTYIRTARAQLGLPTSIAK